VYLRKTVDFFTAEMVQGYRKLGQGGVYEESVSKIVAGKL